MTFHFVVKSLSDLVNESLTLSEEDAVAAASTATSSRLSPSSSSSPRQPQTASAATVTSTNPSTTTAMATSSTTAEPVATTTTAFPTLSSLASEAIDGAPFGQTTEEVTASYPQTDCNYQEHEPSFN